MRVNTLAGITLLTFLALASTLAPQHASAQPPGPCCIVPDNGSGTADHVPSCPSGYVGQMQIIDGLPLGTTIDIAAVIGSFAGLLQVPGGALGGKQETWTATAPLTMTGNGTLAGFNRLINLPIATGETHSAPRVPFSPSQSFNTNLHLLFGQIAGAGDPDFDLLRITAGTNYGYPSPGHTIFTQAVGGWSVDSFFDVYYRIDFVGAPGGQLAGRSGSTTGSYRFTMCHDQATPARRGTWGEVKAFYR